VLLVDLDKQLEIDSISMLILATIVFYILVATRAPLVKKAENSITENKKQEKKDYNSKIFF